MPACDGDRGAHVAISGACALGYEALWARYAGLFLGNTVLLHMAVLATFMGGLAAGSFVLGEWSTRATAPLRMYAVLELLLTAYALGIPQLAFAAQFLVLSAAAHTGGIAPGSLKLVLVCAMLLPPTFLMGGTFPAMTAALVRGRHDSRRLSALLYGANCAGAVAGVLATGLALIPSLGLLATTRVLAITGGTIAAAGFALAFHLSAAPGQPTAPLEKAEALPGSRLLKRAVLASISLSGAAALTYELVWTRLFALTLGSSTYSFTLMLAAFITGLAAGSLAASSLASVRRAPLPWLAATELLIGLTVAVYLPFYQRLPYWFWLLRWRLRPSEGTVWLYHLGQYGITFAVMVVPTILFGAAFAAALLAAGGSRPAGETRAAVEVYGWNTLGTLAGVLAAGCVAIPLLGLRAAIEIGVGLNLLAAGVLIPFASPARHLRTMALVIGVGAVAALLAGPDWQPLAFAQGTFRYQMRPPASWAEYLRGLSSHRVVYSTEDFGTTVVVLAGRNPNGVPERLLVVDGKTDASSYGDMPTQVLLGQVPLFLKPDAQNVFVLGLGSGVTVGSVLTHPVRRVDCAEVSGGVVQAERLFASANGDIRSDPRLRLIQDDGRMALAAAATRYDVIISEPPNPWISGVGNLFSSDFYLLAARRLKPGGLFAQWFHTYEFDDALARMLIHTFRQSFPYAILVNGGSPDFVIIGGTQPMIPDFRAMEEGFRSLNVAHDLDRIGIRTLAALLSRQSHTQAATAALDTGVTSNSDDRPLLEFLAPNAQYAATTARVIPATDCRILDPADLYLTHYTAFRPLSREDRASIIDTLLDPREGNRELARRALVEWIRRWPTDSGRLRLLAGIEAEVGRYGVALIHAQEAGRLGDPEGVAALARALARRGDAGSRERAAAP